MSKEELCELAATTRRVGEIERIGSALADVMRQADRQSAACLAEDLAIEIAALRRDLGRLAEHVLVGRAR